MHAIAGTSPDGKTVYWVGGEVFSLHPADAARFVKEVDTEATILVLKQGRPHAPDTYILIELPDADRE